MIIPLVREEVWQSTLGNLPPFEVPTKRILFISPHPDDEILAAGAFLAAQQKHGIEIAIIAVTDGENAYPENAGLGELRRCEQEAALGQLGILPQNIRRLGLTDSGLQEEKKHLEELLVPFVTSATHIFAPWPGDYHPDHEACGWAAQQVAQRAGASLSWYFFWTWHRGTPEKLRGLELRAFTFDDSLLDRKLKALECHRSQLYRSTDDPVLPESLLGPARRNFEVFACL
jgi:LmbE family N-acetylglucosaminyl deacetylase